VYVMPPYVTTADDFRMLSETMLRCLDRPEI
jgi:adenosylmethionine-8-amino-7-oxononanoate aminotransferase